MCRIDLGIDAGAETVKLAEVAGEGGALEWTRRAWREHHGDPSAAVREVLVAGGWEGVASACATGRLGRRLAVERVSPKRARTVGPGRLHGGGPATIVDLAVRGRMPVSSLLPYAWHESPNIHLCTIRDFERLAAELGLRVTRRILLDADGAEAAGRAVRLRPNAFAAGAVYGLQR